MFSSIYQKYIFNIKPYILGFICRILYSRKNIIINNGFLCDSIPRIIVDKNAHLFIQKDVDRIAKHLNMKPSSFQSKYLKRDDEFDLVLKTSPCTFLAKDNTCTIYETRPRACSEYPHTNRKKMAKILPLTLKNIEVCPAVSRIVDKMKI